MSFGRGFWRLSGWTPCWKQGQLQRQSLFHSSFEHWLLHCKDTLVTYVLLSHQDPQVFACKAASQPTSGPYGCLELFQTRCRTLYCLWQPSWGPWAHFSSLPRLRWGAVLSFDLLTTSPSLVSSPQPSRVYRAIDPLGTVPAPEDRLNPPK